MPKARDSTRLILLCAVCFFASRTLCAQDANKTFVNDLAKHWRSLKSLSLAVAEAIPADAYSPQVPFAESDPKVRGPYEMGSIALTNVLSCAIALGTPVPAGFQRPGAGPMDSTKTGVIKNLTVSYDYCIEGLNQMSDADLLAMSARGFNGHPASKLDILWDAFAHAAHGLGQADLYLLSKGITPPDTGPRFEF